MKNSLKEKQIKDLERCIFDALDKVVPVFKKKKYDLREVQAEVVMQVHRYFTVVDS